MKWWIRGVLLGLCMVLPMVAGCDCGDSTDQVADEVTGKRAIDQGEALKKQLQGLQQDALKKAEEMEE